MSLYASFSEDANGVFSTVAGKIKDSGDGLWSPVYGAGEGNRTLDVSLGSSSFAIKLHPRIVCPVLPGTR